MHVPTTTTEWVLVLFGIMPILIAFVCKFIIILPLLGIGGSWRLAKWWWADVFEAPSAASWYKVPYELPWRNIGTSTIKPKKTATGGQLLGTPEPRFTNLRCSCYQTGKAKWTLSIEFLIENPTSGEIVIDDIHTRLFERDAYQPAYATISRYGDVWLNQDNRLMKDHRSLSLPGGDGFEITLMFECTRVEAAPAYGAEEPEEYEGGVHVVFGLLIDYYFATAGRVTRRVLPSPAIYVFGYPNGISGIPGRELDSIDARTLAAIKSRVTPQNKDFIARLEKHFQMQVSFVAEPA